MALHVNYEFRWKNFRAFRDTGWFTIRPLTILVGPNNSGKTSVHAPLLLLSQTMASRDSVTPLVTRGPLLDFGMFEHVIHNHDTSKELFLGLRYHTHDVSRKLKPVGAYPPGAAEVALTAGERPEDILLTSFEVSDLYKRTLLRQTRNRNGTYKIQSAAVHLKPKERQAVAKSAPVNFLFTPTAALNAYGQSGPSQEKFPSSKYSPAFSMYLSAMAIVFEEVRDLLRELSYVGPLRDRPLRYYPIASELPASVGSHGEHMANLIRRQMPSLQSHLNDWIRRFEFGSQLRVENLSDELFSLFFVRGGARTNIADAGFGASQVLPLIVQALTASKDSLTIAEQPEIHLNPRLQGLLADLFVEMAGNDRRVIVETHSEHLLLRLRRLIATGKISTNHVAVYFVERTDDSSEIRSIPLESDGHISSETWPKGFFEDSLQESLALARAQSTASRKRAQ